MRIGINNLKHTQMKHVNVMIVKHIVPLFLAFAIVTVINSCKRAAEKTSEKIIEKSIGDEAKVAIEDEKIVIQTDEGTFTSDATIHTWPKEVPDDVPKFDYGKITSVTTQEMDDTKNWVIMYEEVSNGTLEKYKEALKTNGFKINYTTMAGTGGHLAAEKDQLMVMVMVGEGNASVTISTPD